MVVAAPKQCLSCSTQKCIVTVLFLIIPYRQPERAIVIRVGTCRRGIDGLYVLEGYHRYEGGGRRYFITNGNFVEVKAEIGTACLPAHRSIFITRTSIVCIGGNDVNAGSGRVLHDAC